MKDHATFIAELGGPVFVASEINRRLNKNHTAQMVSMWKGRGIPYKYRGILTVMAQEQGVKTPPDFFGIGGV